MVEIFHMRAFSRLSIAVKLAVVAGLAIGALFILAAVGVTAYTGSIVKAMGGRYAEAAAQEASQQILNEVTAAGAATKTLAATLGAARETGMSNRQAFMDMVKPSATATDQVMGSWFAGEPNILGSDADYAGDYGSGSDSTGRMSFYWVNQGGKIRSIYEIAAESPEGLAAQAEAESASFSSDYYVVPVTTGKAVVVEPYDQPMNGVSVPMTSVAYPVRVNGKIIGVAGLDITLDNLSRRLAAMKPLGTGRVMLVSAKGVWVAHPDTALRSKPYADAGAKAVQAVLGGGGAQNISDIRMNGEPVVRIVQPVVFPGLNSTWAVVLDIPTSTIEGPAQKLALMLLIGGLVIIAAIIAALVLTSDRLIRRPLARLTASVKSMSDGDYDRQVSGIESGDELGEIARALDGFRIELAESVERREQQQRERAAAEEDRRRHAQEAELFSESQTRAVEALAEGLSRLAAGALAWRMPESAFNTETRRIPEDYNNALQQLHATMTGIWSTAQSIRSGCQDIALAADSLSRRTEQQAAGLEETAAALDELTQTVLQSAESAGRAREVTDAAKSAADRGEQVVREAIEAMSGIEKSSDQIGQIIGVIDEIAFQTNLLALNAGVEAARAGEAGRGFAVVASEVRALAERSASAAKEIKSLIAVSQANVDRGAAQVNLTGESLTAIAAQVAEANSLVRQIAAAAKEQSLGIGEINTAINQMDQFTQQNAAMVEESTAASHALTSEAGELESLIGRFDLTEGGKYAAAA